MVSSLVLVRLLVIFTYTAGCCCLPSRIYRAADRRTYQKTKARLAYIRSNLWSSRAQASHTAVVLVRAHTALSTYTEKG